jgi:hypothetical protein
MSITILAGSSFSAPQTPNSAQIPVVDGGAGSCTADFVVTDAAGKGIYDAKIAIQIRYGFGGFHRLDLMVGTNYEGKARFEGLPLNIRKTAEFTVSHGNQSKSLAYDPLNECHPHQNVTLDGAK